MGSRLKLELEKLFSEDPIVGSENGHAEESVHKGMSSMVADSCNGLSLEELHGNGSLENGKVSINELIGDRSLTSAVEKLSLGAEGTGTGKTWLNHPSLMDGQFESYLNNQPLKTEASTVGDSSLRPSHCFNNGYYEIQMPGLPPQISISARPVSDVHNNEEPGHVPPFETPSSAMPFSLQVPGRNFQFPLSSYHEQMLHSGLSPIHFMHPQQMNHGEIGSNCTKEQQLHSCRMQGQQQYLHDLHNQQLEYSNLFESCRKPAFGSLRFQSPNQQCFIELPFSPHFQMSKHEGFCNRTAHCAGSGIPNLVFTTPYVDPLDAQENSFKQSSPRKVPMRTHGLIGADCMKVPSVDAEKKYYVNQNGFNCPNCYVRQNGFPSTTKDCVCHDNLRGSSMSSSYENHQIEIPPLKCNSLDEATGKIYLMAKDQHGCRFLQRMFSEGTKDDVDMIFGEIIHHVSELMIDPFGNYLIQRLLGYCDEDQRLQILCKVNRPGELIRISCNMHGTRAVQKLIETLKTPEQFSIVVSLLKTGIVILMKNVNGNHVAQHCLQYLMPDYIGFLFDAATKSCVEVATDRHGCCVLQKCLSVSDVRLRDRLLSEVVRNALVLSQDQYGNYVVQFALEHARCPTVLPWVTSGIFKRLEGHFADLSIQKYSSNVVEKCVYAGDECLFKIIDELINDERFSQIMLNPYGNYAVQAVLVRSGIGKPSVHAKLVAAIRPHIPLLRTNMYGKKVLTVLTKVN